MLFSKELINLIIEHTRNHGYNPNIAFIPSHHGGEVGGTLEDKIMSILTLHHADTFGELGCGRGNILLHMKLLYQHNQCFGFECMASRVEQGLSWWSKIYAKLLSDAHGTSNVVNSRRNPQAPNFIEGDFTKDSFWTSHGETLFSQTNLKLFLNNFGDHMLNDGTQTKLELNLDKYCVSGTLIISLSKMFQYCRPRDSWIQKNVIYHQVKAGDMSWKQGRDGGEIEIYVYQKY